MDYDVKDIKLADQGKLKIEWAEATMPVLRLIRKRFKKQQPFFFEGPVQDPAFRLQRLDGKEVVAHDVGQRKMGHRRNEIAEKESDLPFRFDLDPLVPARMAGRDDGGDTGE